MIKYVHIHVYAHPCGEQRLHPVIVAQRYSTLFFAFVFVRRECMCASIIMKLQMCVGNACMSVCMCLHMCTHMWKPGVDVKCHPQSLSTLYTEQSFSLLHRAQRYWNSGQPACFRDILSPFLLRSSLSLRFTSPQTGYVS